VRFETTHEAFLVDGQAASVIGPEGLVVGFLGQVTPAMADARGLPRQHLVFVADLNLDLIARLARPTGDATMPLPRHPVVVRDLSIVVDESLPAEIIRGTIQAASRIGTVPLVDVAFFDRYQGKGVPDGRVSVSVRLTFQAADRTLTDVDVQQSFDAILSALVREHGAVQR
jgi:phenylalanyl-tRNA synthetase beta chain